MVDSLQKVLLQRCDKEGKTIQKFDFHLLLFEVVSEEMHLSISAVPIPPPPPLG